MSSRDDDDGLDFFELIVVACFTAMLTLASYRAGRDREVLHELFKRETGITVEEWRAQQAIESAKEAK